MDNKDNVNDRVKISIDRDVANILKSKMKVGDDYSKVIKDLIEFQNRILRENIDEKTNVDDSGYDYDVKFGSG